MLVFFFGEGGLRRPSQQNFNLQGFCFFCESNDFLFCDPLVPEKLQNTSVNEGKTTKKKKALFPPANAACSLLSDEK